MRLLCDLGGGYAVFIQLTSIRLFGYDGSNLQSHFQWSLFLSSSIPSILPLFLSFLTRWIVIPTSILFELRAVFKQSFSYSFTMVTQTSFCSSIVSLSLVIFINNNQRTLVYGSLHTLGGSSSLIHFGFCGLIYKIEGRKFQKQLVDDAVSLLHRRWSRW